jgi:hypothetical protein
VARFIRGTLVIAVVFVCSLSADGALANGGPTISGAPPIAYGQPNFGNLTNVTSDSDGCQREFWRLPVIAGDHVTLTWSALNSDTTVFVYPAGTTDSSWARAKVVAEASSNNGGTGKLGLSAVRTGDMTVMFVDQNRPAFPGCANPGPYNFTASVVHRMIVSLRAVRKTTLYYATFRLTIYNPDGARIVPPGTTFDYLEQTRGYVPGEYGTLNAPPFKFVVHWGILKTDYRMSLRVIVSALGYRTALSNWVTVLASSHCGCD